MEGEIFDEMIANLSLQAQEDELKNYHENFKQFKRRL